MKALAVIRVSTEGQQVLEQREELYAYIKSMGYEEIVPVEAIGASAIKLDERYMDMANKIKQTILEGGIDAVCVWEISRLGRNEVILMDFKEFFIKHKVQFICKNPSLKLLNEDGSVNTGTELAFSLFATMSKQEMLEKKARFKRAKKGMAQRGEYIGGHVVPYGYTVVGREYVADEEESKIVRLVFELYSTGNYSASSLSEELNQRGYSITDRKVTRILAYKGYIGEAIGELGTRFPPIVSKDIFDICQKIRTNNKLNMRRGERLVMGSKLIKCFRCGAVCTSNSKHYVCCRAAHKLGCDNTFHLRQNVADELLWRVAQTQHLQYLTDLNENKVEQYLQELGVVDEKINAGLEKLKIIQGKKDRIAENYEDGLISKKTRDLRLLKVQNEVRVHQEYLSSLQGKREAIAGLLEGGNPDSVEAFLAALDTMDSESKFDIIHKHIKSLTAEPISFGVRDPRTHKPNGVKIIVTTILDTTEDFIYVPKQYRGFNLYVRNRNRWVPDMYLI